MGYFSMKDLEHEDFSYPPPERQLEMRLDFLRERLRELQAKYMAEGIFYFFDPYISDDDLRYVLPENLWYICHAERAIELAIQDLREKYGIIVTENGYREYDGSEQTAATAFDEAGKSRFTEAA